jgi:ADP-ribosylation factor-like protein 1
MGFIFSKIFGSILSNKEVRLIILGLDNAGKTTILCKIIKIIIFIDKMQLGEVMSTVPSKIIFCKLNNSNGV